MTFLFLVKLFHLVSWTQRYKIMKVFWTSRNFLYIIVWYLEEEEQQQQQYIFTFKKFTKLVPKKIPIITIRW